MIRVAIVGGGISGLTTAFYLEQERRRGAPIEFTVFEGSPRFGGAIQTERVDGCLIEAGPDSFLTSKPWARQLCEDLRLSSQLMGSRDGERKTYVLVKGRLEPIPAGMQMMVPTNFGSVLRSKLFSTRTKFAMLGEYFSPPDPLPADEDESVAGFVQRHFNAEVVERLGDPLLSGIYGSDSSSLSVRATLPQMVEREAKYRSLVRAAVAAKAESRNGTQPSTLFTTLRDGMQRMVDALVRQLPREGLRSSQSVERLELRESGWQVSGGAIKGEFDQVILALPPHATAKLMTGVSAAERPVEILSEFKSSSAVIVALAFKAADVLLPSGFGFLVPRSEGKRMVACTFVHNKFENRAPEGIALLRVFLGGTRDPEACQLNDSEIVQLVCRELREVLRLTAEPQLARVFRWKDVMPQYGVGHLLRVAGLEMNMQRFPGLHLGGNAYHGIGIPDCVRLGRSAADAIMRRMRSQRAPA